VSVHRWIQSAAIALGAASVVGAAAGEPTEPEAPQQGEIALIDQTLLLRFLADHSTFTLLDARSAEEFAVGHIVGAKNVPHDRIDAHADALPADRGAAIVAYCRTGKRAAALKEQLAARGFTNVRVLGPGQLFWSETAPMFNCGVAAPPSAPFLIGAMKP
jgi:phage shock protein E